MIRAASIRAIALPPKRMELAELLSPIAADMGAIDQLIRDELQSDVVLINQIGHHIVAGGGKRMRPALVALAAQALGHDDPRVHTAAAIIEFIHTATLLHDDVVDESSLRRGRETANAAFGNAASVLTGDFLYSRAFELMVRLDTMPVMELLASTTNAIAEGEVLQLMNIGNPDISEAQYLDVIDRKTARLFRAATMLPALLAGSSQTQIDAMDRYGQSLGMAFQLVDDALDYLGDESSLGKHVGDDLAEGKPTLPLLRVLRDGSPAAQARVRRAITEATDEELDAIIQDIHAAGAIDQTLQLARHYADAAVDALGALPATPGRNTLAGLARFAVERVS